MVLKTGTSAETSTQASQMDEVTGRRNAAGAGSVALMEEHKRRVPERRKRHSRHS
jgi:hypothetical protein